MNEESITTSSRTPDYFSEAGAKILAHRIERYWKAEGFMKVMVAIVPIPTNNRYHIAGFTIKSNIGIGGPPA